MGNYHNAMVLCRPQRRALVVRHRRQADSAQQLRKTAAPMGPVRGGLARAANRRVDDMIIAAPGGREYLVAHARATGRRRA